MGCAVHRPAWRIRSVTFVWSEKLYQAVTPALTQELVYLNPTKPGPFALVSEQPGGLAENFAGGSNYFAYTIDIPVQLQRNVQLSKPFKTNTVTFSVAVQLANGGVGPPAPGAVTASASLATVTNGVIFVYNNLNLVRYLFSGNTANYELQGSAQPPVPIAADLLSAFPTLHIAVGVQLPVPCIGTAAAPGAGLAAPTILTATATQPYDTSLLLLGDPLQ